MAQRRGATRRSEGLLQLDLDVDTGGQIELHQGINGFVRGIDDVHQAKVGPDLELITRGLVDVRRTQNVITLDAGNKQLATASAFPAPLFVRHSSSSNK